MDEVGKDSNLSRQPVPGLPHLSVNEQRPISARRIYLEFGRGEKLLSAREGGSWSANNARIIERALFRAFNVLGIQIPFPYEDIDSGVPQAEYPQDLPIENPKDPPVFWMRYRLEVPTDAGFVSTYPTIKTHSELAELLGAMERIYPTDKHLGRKIRLEMIAWAAEQLTPENLKNPSKRGILKKIAVDMMRYMPPGSSEKLKGVTFILPEST